MTILRNATWLALTSLVLVIGGCRNDEEGPPAGTEALLLTAPTPDFWGPDDFDGSYDSAGEQPLMNGQTTWSGDIVFANLPRGVVDDVLPADLKLATNRSGDMPTEHPVVLMFGRHKDLRSIMPPLPVGPPYNELILMIPFVQKAGGQKLHSWVVRMYLDWQMGVDGGNLLYGYRKELADLSREVPVPTPPEFIFKVTQAGTAMFNGQVTGVTSWMNDSAAKASLKNYKAMKAVFLMPILGTWPASYALASPYVCSYFELDWDAVQVRSATTRFQFLAKFAPNMDSWVSAGTLGNLQDGDFGVTDLEWVLTMPITPCKF